MLNSYTGSMWRDTPSFEVEGVGHVVLIASCLGQKITTLNLPLVPALAYRKVFGHVLYIVEFYIGGCELKQLQSTKSKTHYTYRACLN